MSRHLTHKPKAPWHWDGHDPLDMDNRIVAQSLREQGGCEPDMRKGKCESCGAAAVYGAEELMFHMVA